MTTLSRGRVAPGRGRPAVLAAAGWLLVDVLAAATIHFFVTKVPWEADTTYHVAVGRIIRTHGMLQAFPWTPFSWLAEHYADKELFFHLLFVPLAGLPWITAAKIIGTLLGGLLLWTLYVVLRAEGVPLAGVWSLLPLVASGAFTFRFALVRPHLLSIPLAVLLVWALARRKLVVVGLASAAYPWAYVAWPLPIVLAAIVEATHAVAGKKPRWQPAGVAALGIAAGLALHPNTLNLIRFSWIQIGDVLLRRAWSGSTTVELGPEFAPFPLELWASLLAGTVAMAIAALAIAWRHRRDAPVALAFAVTAVLFGLLTVKTARFAEYFVPFSVAALALATRAVPWRLVYTGMLALGLILYSARPLDTMAKAFRGREESIRPELSAFLRRVVPPGAQVFTCDVGTTGDLLLALPERRFLVALDPTFFLIQDPERYASWFRLTHDAPPGAAAVIRRDFGAQFVICQSEEGFRPLLEQLVATPGVRTLVRRDWHVIDLRGTGTAPP